MSTWRSLLQKDKTYELSIPLRTGETYTVSVDQEPVEPLEVWLGNTYYGDLVDDLTVTPTAPHETLTLVPFHKSVIRTVKLELGTLPTAYTRAPEDIEAEIAAAQSKANAAIQLANTNKTTIDGQGVTITRLEGSVKSGGQNLILNSDFNTDKWWTINKRVSWDLIAARFDSWDQLEAQGVSWQSLETYDW